MPRPPRPRRRRILSTARSGLATGGWPSSTWRPATSRWRASTDRSWIVFNGEIYNFRELRRGARGPRASVPHDVGHRGDPARLRGVRGRSASGGCAACSRFAIWDGRRRAPVPRPGPRRHQAAGLRLGRPPPRCSAPRSRRCSRTRRCRASSTGTPLRDYLAFTTCRAPARSSAHDPEAAPGLPTSCSRSTGGDAGDPVGTGTSGSRPTSGGARPNGWRGCARISPDASGGTWSPTCRSARSSPAGSTRARWSRSWPSAAPAPVRTFSIGFDEADFDELALRPAGRRALRHRALASSWSSPTPSRCCRGSARQFDEPFADSSAMPDLLRVEDHARARHGGAVRRRRRRELRRLPPVRARRRPCTAGWTAAPAGSRARCSGLRRPAAAAGRARASGYLELLGADPIERYFRMVAAQRRRAPAPPRRGRARPGRARWATPPATSGGWPRRQARPTTSRRSSTLDVQTYLPEDILTKVDRTSMPVSLEVAGAAARPRLMEFVATMPTRLKLRDGTGQGRSLKRAMADALPARRA